MIEFELTPDEFETEFLGPLIGICLQRTGLVSIRNDEECLSIVQENSGKVRMTLQETATQLCIQPTCTWMPGQPFFRHALGVLHMNYLGLMVDSESKFASRDGGKIELLYDKRVLRIVVANWTEHIVISIKEPR